MLIIARANNTNTGSCTNETFRAVFASSCLAWTLLLWTAEATEPPRRSLLSGENTGYQYLIVISGDTDDIPSSGDRLGSRK